MCIANSPHLRKRPYPKGRKMPPDFAMGERNPARKLTWLQVAEIREAKRGYGVTKALSQKFKVSRSMIRRIRAGKYWIFDRHRSRWSV